MSKKILIFIGIGIITAGLGIGVYFFLIPRCPASCDDGYIYTQDVCSKETNYKCSYTVLEKYCRNKICEVGETYETCPEDCPDCNDNNKCTKDNYNYRQQKCINETIIPCCGNGICDKDAETYLDCSIDCSNCDDKNNLTTDSFNYKIQKCENIATHYFIDDFEKGIKGIQNWFFGDKAAWSTIIEGDNTVLRGWGDTWAEPQGKEWDNYGLKFRFKRIKGEFLVEFRRHLSEGGHIRYSVWMPQGEVNLGRRGPNENFQTINFVFDENWHTFEIRGYDNILNVYIDGELLIKYKDTKYPILSGGVTIFVGEDSEFLFDDVEIKVINKEDIIYP